MDKAKFHIQHFLIPGLPRDALPTPKPALSIKKTKQKKKNKKKINKK